jgi:hypothetical protein
MSFLQKLKNNHSAESTRTSSVAESEKSAAHADTTPVDSDEDSVSKEAQAGVQKAEATTSVWSKSHLITAYILYDRRRNKYCQYANNLLVYGSSTSLAQCSKA